MLVVYYSMSFGNTEKIALQLTKETNADSIRLETLVPYPKEHERVVSQGKREVDSGFEPKLRPVNHNMSEYDVIAIASPTWWYTVAPAVKTFLKENNWQGKTVIPIITHAGWPGHGIDDIKAACKGADIVQEIEIQFDSDSRKRDQMMTTEKRIQQWIDEIKHII